jgi:hypothetical protein
MATFKISYRAAATITITLAGLTNGSTNTSNAIDNSTNLDVDARIQVKVKSNAAGTIAGGYVNVFYIGSSDGGTTYDDNNKELLMTIPVTANATTYIMSRNLSKMGIVPSKFFKIAVANNSGAALDATAGNHLAQYEGVQYTSV